MTTLLGAEFDVLSDDSEYVLSRLNHRISPVDRMAKPTVELVLSQAHPEYRPAIQELIDRVTREIEDWQLEHRLLMPDGVVKQLHVVAHAVHDDATDETEYVGAAMDVTAATESRRALESAYAEIQVLKDRLQSENIVLERAGTTNGASTPLEGSDRAERRPQNNTWRGDRSCVVS